ncbi:hypothetical protein GOV04_00935 [Candidatus Woesearchaeota archaeon]|nr:hypothetical protein [Candidatus Woesearchaeota archaeon]
MEEELVLENVLLEESKKQHNNYLSLVLMTVPVVGQRHFIKRLGSKNSIINELSAGTVLAYQSMVGSGIFSVIEYITR